MIAAPLLVLGLLLILSAVFGAGVASRGRGPITDVLLSPIHPASWAAVAAVLAGFFVALFAFGTVVSLFSAGTSLLVVGIGFVLLALGLEDARWYARFERRRARWADPRPLRPHPYRPYGSSVRELVAALFFDLSRWRDVIYLFIALPLAMLELAAAAALWSASLALLSTPMWIAFGDLQAEALAGVLPGEGLVLWAFALGLGLLPVAAAGTRGLMTLHRAVVAGLLCESEQRALERRVQALEVSRRTVMDVEASELRRIERDLHDGAQQRLVMLSMQLGLAAERIETDPSGARELVADARDQARQALAELRDLVRGIAPAILLDRGLAPALSALAGRSPVATVVTSELPEGARLPDAIERAAYFVVAESVANAAKHAGATRIEIRLRRAPAGLVVEIEDDGSGGARILPTGGLAGLRGRVEGVDGRLTVSSPTGGPTLVRAELPVWATADDRSGLAAPAASGAIQGWYVPPGWGPPAPRVPGAPPAPRPEPGDAPPQEPR